jgi:acyl carrier protein
MTNVQVLSQEAFTEYLASELELEADRLAPEIRFLEDLGFDSIQFLELVLVVEDLGVDFPEELIASINTVADAYAWYSTIASRS